MAEKKVEYHNIWTKLHLGGVRGSKLFKGVWRALRVGGLTALLFFVQKVLPGLDFLPSEFIPIIAVAVEKWVREYLTALDF